MFVHPEPGTFLERRTPATFAGKRALFLDRDGVIVEETNYLHSIADVHFIPGVAEAVARVNAAGHPVIMITNQAGIGRGYYGWDAFLAVQTHIHAYFQGLGARFDMVLACAYHEAGQDHYAVPDHHWRKPNPGMLHEAARLLEVDLTRSFVVGDTLSDMRAGQAAGLPAGALVMTGHGQREWDEHGPGQFAILSENGFAVSRWPSAAQAIGTQLR